MCSRRCLLSMFIAAGLGLTTLSVAAFAQLGTATLSGRVTDQAQAAVSGATVTAVNQDTGIPYSRPTDGRGNYTIPALPPGMYRIDVELTGFKKIVRSNIVLRVQDALALNFGMEVGAVTEQVTVTAEAPVVETTTSTVSNLVSESEVRELPLNGRGFAQLISIQPGVQSVSGGGGGYQLIGSPHYILWGMGSTSIMASGQRPESTTYLLDSGDLSTGLGRGSPLSGGGDMLGVEAIREFKVLSQFDASHGKVAGAVMTAVSRSGTNTLRGSAFYFRRDSALDARDYFDGPELPPFHRNQFGGTLGGPVIRDKTFFFGGYEGLRQQLQLTRTGFVPDENARRGILPGVAPFTVSPAITPFLALYPLPNGENLGSGVAIYNFIGDFPSSQNQFLGRIDHNISSKTTLFGRYMYSDGSTDSTLQLPIFHQAVDNRYQYLALSSTQTFSPRMVNQLSIFHSRTYIEPAPGLTSTPDPALLLFGGTEMPSVSVGGSGSFQAATVSSLGTGSPLSAAMNGLVLRDDLTMLLGNHTLSFGGEFDHYSLEFNQPAAERTGSFRFTDLQDFLRGRPSSLNFSTDTAPQNNYKQYYGGLYVQDNFRATTRLSINWGLRYEIVTAPSEKDDNVTSLDSRQPTNPPIIGELWRTSHTFGPRMGLAWDPTGSGKTAIRAGGGVYYTQILGGNWVLNTIFNRYPGRQTGRINNPPFPDIPETLLTNTIPESAVFFLAWDRNLKVPTSVQYNLSIQREIVPNLGVTIAYVGSSNSHGFEATKFNHRVPVSFIAPGQPLYAAGQPRIYPRFGELVIYTSDSNSNYNSLDISVDKRASRGIELSGSYTFAKVLSDFDMMGAESLTQHFYRQNPFDRHQDYARARFDVRHKVTLRGLWELPFGKERAYGGWGFSGIFTARSGMPLTPTIQLNNSLDGWPTSPNERPSLPAGTAVPMPRTAAQWFDASVFTLSAPGTYGNVGRNTIDLPGSVTLDLALTKTFNITEQQRLVFRWEAFNTLNHTNFGVPQKEVITASGVLSPTAGRITQTASPPRKMQLSLKYHF